tara:strand:- start:946 stop:1866 length:921 start_codon:yes stop_codon:yes gene_type:complete
MALINCPECNKEISDKSAHCINCGAPKNVILESLKKASQSKMTLIKCTNCLKVISGKSTKCINCGVILNEVSDSENKKIVIEEESKNDLDKKSETDVYEFNETEEIFVIFHRDYLNKNDAINEVIKLRKEGYFDSGYIYTPNYVSDFLISNPKHKYLVFLSKHESEKICSERLSQESKINPNAFGLLVSKYKNGILVKKNRFSKSLKFNNNNPLYKPIKILNIGLIILSCFFVFISKLNGNGGSFLNCLLLCTIIIAFIKYLFLKSLKFRQYFILVKLIIVVLIWTSVFLAVEKLFIPFLINFLFY